MTDWRWIRIDLLELLVLAMLDRAGGNNKGALEYLDAATEIFAPEIKRTKKRGRKPLARDPDKTVVWLMDNISKRTGETSAKKLARRVLRFPTWRRADKSTISESDVKRLADKWKAQREIKSD